MGRLRTLLAAARPGGTATIVAIVLLGLTAGAFFVSRDVVASRERAALREQATRIGNTISRYGNRIQATLDAGSIVAETTGGDPGRFREAMADWLNGPAISSITLLDETPGGFVPVARAGPSGALLLAHLDPRDVDDLERISDEHARAELLKVGMVDGRRVVAYAISGADDGSLAVYGETVMPALRRLVQRTAPAGVRFALYAGPATPANLLASSAGDRSLGGDTLSEPVRFGGQAATVVVATSVTLVDGLTAARPWVILIIGVLVAVGAALLVELARHRSAAELERRSLEEQNTRLREVDRMKDELVATVSHELRTPLTSILGYLELMSEDAFELSAEHREFVDVIDRNARRLLALVGDLLFIARIDGGGLTLEIDDVDLAAVVRESVEALRPRADQAGLTVQLQGDDVEPVRGERAKLSQLVDNLLSNAVKFTPAGGCVRVQLRREGSSAVLEVEDTGSGIPEADRDRVFDRFFRSSSATAAAVPGTGLGLAISKAIVTAHGGTIGLESENGQGTTFRVTLPLAADADAAGTGSGVAVGARAPAS